MKRIFTLAAVVLLLLAALTVVGCSSGGKTPEETESPMDILMDVFDKTAASRENGDTAVGEFWDKVKDSGLVSTDMTLPAGFPLRTLSSKQYFGSASAAFYTLTNTQGNALSFSQWEENDKMVITASPWEGNYGVTYDDIAVLLGYFQGAENALSFTEILAHLADLEDAFLALSDETEALFEAYATIEPVMTDDGLSVKVTVSGKNLPLFIKDLYGILKNDTAFHNALDTLCRLFGGAASDLFNDSEIDTLCRNLTSDPVALFATLSCNNARVMRKAVITLFDEDAGADGNSVYGEERLSLTLSLGQDGDFGFEIYTNDEEYSFDYDVTDSETRKKVSISVGTSTVQLTPITYTYTKQDGSFRLVMDIPTTMSAEFSGSYHESPESATLKIDKITYTTYAGDSIIPGFSIGIPMVLDAKLLITASLKETAPATPTDYREFSDLSAEEIAALADALANDPVVADTLAFLELIGQLINGSDTESEGEDSGFDFGFDFDLGDIFA